LDAADYNYYPISSKFCLFTVHMPYKSFTLDSDEMIVDIMYGWWAASMHTQYLVSVREGGDPYSLDISDLGL
jgi:hypothetical protein